MSKFPTVYGGIDDGYKVKYAREYQQLNSRIRSLELSQDNIYQRANDGANTATSLAFFMGA